MSKGNPNGPATVPTRKIKLVVTKRIKTLLKDLTATGLYGLSVEDTAEQMLLRGIESNTAQIRAILPADKIL